MWALYCLKGWGSITKIYERVLTCSVQDENSGVCCHSAKGHFFRMENVGTVRNRLDGSRRAAATTTRRWLDSEVIPAWASCFAIRDWTVRRHGVPPRRHNQACCGGKPDSEQTRMLVARLNPYTGKFSRLGLPVPNLSHHRIIMRWSGSSRVSGSGPGQT